MSERMPDPREKPADPSKRETLRTIGTVAAGTLGGTLGGMIAGGLRREVPMQNPEVQEPPPSKEEITATRRYQDFIDAVAKGDQECIATANGLLSHYRDELEREVDYCTSFQKQLMSSGSGEGARALLEGAIDASKMRQEWLLTHITLFKDPIQEYLDKNKKKSMPGIQQSPRLRF